MRFGQVPVLLDNLPDSDVGCGACVMVTVCPATVRVPIRCEVVGFAATAYLVVPFRTRAPEAMLSQDAPADDVHGQIGDDAVMPTGALLAPAPTDWLVGETVKVHGGKAAACEIENSLPAIISVVSRVVRLRFGATVNLTVPLPVLSRRQ